MAQPGFVLDTNLMVLFVVGLTSPTEVGRHQRLVKFEPFDFDLLVKVLNGCGGPTLIPNVVTETSTLLGHGRKSSTDDYAQVLAGLIRDLDEVYVASKDAVERSDFARLGVTDSALLQMASEEFDLLTDDEPLYRTAVEVGCRAVLFSQLREYARQIR